MFGSAVLDIGIGLVLVFLMVSLVCTAANEMLASMFAWRADTLHDGIHNLLDGSLDQSRVWTAKFFDHPLVRSLSRSTQKPSYIPSRTFALAVMDLVLPPGPGPRPSTAAELRAAIDSSPAPDTLKKVLQMLTDEADRSSVAGDRLRRSGILDLQKLDPVVEQLHAQIEIWFNTTMERVSGWYKRRVHAWTIGIAVVLTVLLNVDAVQIANHLARDSALRAAVVAEAQNGGTLQDLKSIGVPLGWPNPDGPLDRWGYLLKALGLLLTASAASLGAPFWFDVLNKFMAIRSAGKAPEETPKAPKQLPMPMPPGHGDIGAAPAQP